MKRSPRRHSLQCNRPQAAVTDPPTRGPQRLRVLGRKRAQTAAVTAVAVLVTAVAAVVAAAAPHWILGTSSTFHGQSSASHRTVDASSAQNSQSPGAAAATRTATSLSYCSPRQRKGEVHVADRSPRRWRGWAYPLTPSPHYWRSYLTGTSPLTTPKKWTNTQKRQRRTDLPLRASTQTRR